MKTIVIGIGYLVGFCIIIVFCAFLAMTGVIVCSNIRTARQKVAWEAFCEKRIQELTEDGRRFTVSYYEDGGTAGIFVLKDQNEITIKPVSKKDERECIVYAAGHTEDINAAINDDVAGFTTIGLGEKGIEK